MRSGFLFQSVLLQVAPQRRERTGHLTHKPSPRFRVVLDILIFSLQGSPFVTAGAVRPHTNHLRDIVYSGKACPRTPLLPEMSTCSAGTAGTRHPFFSSSGHKSPWSGHTKPRRIAYLSIYLSAHLSVYLCIISSRKLQWPAERPGRELRALMPPPWNPP